MISDSADCRETLRSLKFTGQRATLLNPPFQQQHLLPRSRHRAVPMKAHPARETGMAAAVQGGGDSRLPAACAAASRGRTPSPRPALTLHGLHTVYTPSCRSQVHKHKIGQYTWHQDADAATCSLLGACVASVPCSLFSCLILHWGRLSHTTALRLLAAASGGSHVRAHIASLSLC